MLELREVTKPWLGVVLAIAAVWARPREASSEESGLQLEELPAADILALDLHKDGVMH